MIFALKGDIVYSKDYNELCEHKDSYVICENHRSLGIFDTLPEQYKEIKVFDYSNHLIIPGLVDLHLHAPQYPFIGINMDLQLIDWLNTYTFKEESKYKDLSYAKKAYDIFVEKLRLSATTRAVMFATIHKDSTKYLFDIMEQSGLVSYVGKVNQDRNSSNGLLEQTDISIKDTLDIIEYSLSFKNTKPIITPRFVPTCSNELMKELGNIAKSKELKIQSHLCENISEIEWVKELEPESRSYGDAYDRFGLFGENGQAIMAHCIYLNDLDIDLIKNKKVFIAHCPSSNRNLSSGIAPIRKYIESGINIGLATDVSGGSYLNMFRAIEDCITASKMRYILLKEDSNFVNFKESFYMATKGGGMFFGKVGSFEKDYEFDALVLDESDNPTILFDSLTLSQRLERFVYNPNPRLTKKFVFGKEIF